MFGFNLIKRDKSHSNTLPSSQPRLPASKGPIGNESILFVLDQSGSMMDHCSGRQSKLAAAKKATIAMIEARLRMGACDQIAIISFGDIATLVLPFTSSEQSSRRIIRAVKSIRIAGGTNLNAPLVMATQLLDTRRHETLHIVMLTDGQGGDPLATAYLLKQSGAILETIGVGNSPYNVDENLLKAVASVVNGKVLYRFIRDSDQLIEYFSTEVATRLVKR